jgi:adenosylhomocysteine nucleosidase
MSRIGIVIALPGEARSLLGKTIALDRPMLSDDRVVMVSGMGPARAENCANSLIKLNISALSTWGTAGALDPALRAGDVLIPGSVGLNGAKTFPTDPAWRQRVLSALPNADRPATGTALQVAKPVTTSAGKRQLFQDTGAAAVDMESYAVASAAAQAGIPFLCLRAIADTAAHDLSPRLLQAVDPYGRLRWDRMFSLIHWQEILGLITLARAFRQALASLRRLAHTLGPRLAFDSAPI